MAVYMGAYLRLARARILRQQLRPLDQHAVVAIAAVRRLLVDEGLLQRMQRRGLCEPVALRVPGSEALERSEGFVRHRGHRRDAGPDLDAVGEHRAGAALREPAAE